MELRIALTFMLLVSLTYCQKSVNNKDKSKAKIPIKIAREGEDLSKIENVFVPTKEWQPIKPDQTVPRGLHIRMNLETGNVEAKLLDESETAKTQNSAVVHVKDPAEDEIKPEGEGMESLAESEKLKEMLKKIKDESSPPQDSKTAEEFRSYEDIKKDLADLNFSIKTDYEIMTNLVGRFRNSLEPSESVAVLNDLEYYIHQYDNALDFVQMGGFRDLILPSLNSTDEELRSTAAFLVGSAAQSNPKVQIAALELGLVPQLLRIVANDPSFKVKSTSVYAISCISRNFPLAQQEIVQHGGVSAFARVFESSSAESLKLQVKIITLFNDFMTERIEPEEHGQLQMKAEVKLDSERKRQYETANLERALLEQGFCQLINKMLGELNPEDLDEKHDDVEKVVRAVDTFLPLCRREFTDNIQQIKKLVNVYRDLSRLEIAEASGTPAENESEPYYTSLLQLSELLYAKLVHRDEL